MTGNKFFSAHHAYSERQRHILAAAGHLFLQHGYTGTTTDMIISAVGGSKRDLYRCFATKDILFQRSVEVLSQQVLNVIRSGETDNEASPDLEAFARRYLRILLDPTTLALRRLVIAEAARAPDVAETFLSAGPRQMLAYVAAILQTCGIAPPPGVSPGEMSRLFLGALAADLQLRALLGQTISEDERRRAASAAVALITREG